LHLIQRSLVVAEKARNFLIGIPILEGGTVGWDMFAEPDALAFPHQ
jgi:hypothetical protein